MENDQLKLFRKLLEDKIQALRKSQAADMAEIRKRYQAELAEFNKSLQDLDRFESEKAKEVDFSVGYNSEWTWWEKGAHIISKSESILSIAEIFEKLLLIDAKLSGLDQTALRNRKAALSGAMADSVGVNIFRYEYRDKDFIYGWRHQFDQGGFPITELIADLKIRSIFENKLNVKKDNYDIVG